MKSDLHDLTMQLHHETDRAVLVSDDGEREHAVWLPKSRIEMERCAEWAGAKPGCAIVVVTLPERLAIEKGLL